MKKNQRNFDDGVGNVAAGPNISNFNQTSIQLQSGSFSHRENPGVAITLSPKNITALMK